MKDSPCGHQRQQAGVPQPVVHPVAAVHLVTQPAPPPNYGPTERTAAWVPARAATSRLRVKATPQTLAKQDMEAHAARAATSHLRGGGVESGIGSIHIRKQT